MDPGFRQDDTEDVAGCFARNDETQHSQNG
jgi:hypothetical protein